MQNRIEVKSLRGFINSIFDHMENDLHIKSIEIDSLHNNFWEVPLDDMFKLGDSPPELGIGSTIDSIEFINTSIGAGAKDSYAATLMFMHVIPLLNVICHKVRA